MQPFAAYVPYVGRTVSDPTGGETGSPFWSATTNQSFAPSLRTVYDKYRRTIANALLPDGTNVNHALVEEGWCWWYQKYAQGDTVLETLETEARESKRGLWADPHPVPPWEWRKRGRN